MRTATYSGDVSEAQIQWGSHTDPRSLLIPHHTYIVESIDVHTNHTKVFLVNFPGCSFNSVWFEDLDLSYDIEEWQRARGLL